MKRLKSSILFQQSRQITKPVCHFLKKFFNDWSLNFAAMLSYNLLIALLPMAVALFGILGFVFRNYPDVRNGIRDQIVYSFSSNNTMQAGVKQVIDLALNQLSEDAVRILTIGIAFATFGASRLFIAIDKCMSIVYRVPERPFLRENLLGFAAFFVFIILVPVMLILSSAPSVLVNVMPSIVGRFGTFVIGIICSLLSAFILFEFMYWLIPNKKMSFKTTWCGALIAAFILELFIILFPFYVKQFMGNYTGQLGFAVILILFLYYFATIIILGAQINAFFFENYRPFADGLGTYLSEMDNENNTQHNRTRFDEETTETAVIKNPF